MSALLILYLLTTLLGMQGISSQTRNQTYATHSGSVVDILESTGIRRSLEMLGFPCSSAGKESARNEGDLGSIPRLGKSPGEGTG